MLSLNSSGSGDGLHGNGHEAEANGSTGQIHFFCSQYKTTEAYQETK